MLMLFSNNMRNIWRCSSWSQRVVIMRRSRVRTWMSGSHNEPMCPVTTGPVRVLHLHLKKQMVEKYIYSPVTKWRVVHTAHNKNNKTIAKQIIHISNTFKSHSVLGAPFEEKQLWFYSVHPNVGVSSGYIHIHSDDRRVVLKKHTCITSISLSRS